MQCLFSMFNVQFDTVFLVVTDFSVHKLLLSCLFKLSHLLICAEEVNGHLILETFVIEPPIVHDCVTDLSPSVVTCLRSFERRCIPQL